MLRQVNFLDTISLDLEGYRYSTGVWCSLPDNYLEVRNFVKYTITLIFPSLILCHILQSHVVGQ